MSSPEMRPPRPPSSPAVASSASLPSLRRSAPQRWAWAAAGRRCGGASLAVLRVWDSCGERECAPELHSPRFPAATHPSAGSSAAPAWVSTWRAWSRRARRCARSWRQCSCAVAQSAPGSALKRQPRCGRQPTHAAPRAPRRPGQAGRGAPAPEAALRRGTHVVCGGRIERALCPLCQLSQRLLARCVRDQQRVAREAAAHRDVERALTATQRARAGARRRYCGAGDAANAAPAATPHGPRATAAGEAGPLAAAPRPCAEPGAWARR